MGRGQIPPSGPPFAEHPCGGAPCGAFVGSGAVFLNAGFASYLLCDLNADLIGLYRTLRRDGERFMRRRGPVHAGQHTQEAFLRLRETFNASSDAEERSVLFLYLNRHSYNGLVRYNSKGIYNVPFGKYKAPYFPERELTAFLDKLRGCDVAFAVQDFRSTFAALRPGDVVYCDPPYAPVSATANFTSYTGGGFGVQEQIDLASEASAAAKRGVPVVREQPRCALSASFMPMPGWNRSRCSGSSVATARGAGPRANFWRCSHDYGAGRRHCQQAGQYP